MNSHKLDFYKNKTVLVTGCTGFKGSWLCEMLVNAGANVVGYALAPEDTSLFNILRLKDRMHYIEGDICSVTSLYEVFQSYEPEIVFHLAAQPLVIESYKHPKETYNTNVFGTLNLLECIKNMSCVKSLVNITTDKVYLNNDKGTPFKETDALCGLDPYSNSKSCVELVTYSYYHSFLKDRNVNIVTMRAGNVIGGGDFATNRIVPDCVRDTVAGNKINVRNPNSCRPYQHVLDALWVYLLVGIDTYYGKIKFDSFNIGPDSSTTTAELVSKFCKYWGEDASWESDNLIKKAPKEANNLVLNTDYLKYFYSWNQIWDVDTSIERCVEWYKAYSKKDIEYCIYLIDKQIDEFLDEVK